MAKTKRTKGTNGTAGGETVSGYFREILEESPALLDGKTNEELLQRWLADHPEHKEVPQNVKASLSTLKSVLRSKKRKKSGRKQRAVAVAGGDGVVATVPTTQRPSHHLETLEECIDDCLTLAKGLDREEFQSVIKHLRRARNEVVWKIGV